MNSRQILWRGLVKENPTLVLLLGTCPTLAVTTQAVNSIGMGLATTMVLICSNAVISLLKNIIPDKVRIPCYITLIAGFVIMVSLLMEAYLPAMYEALGLYLSLIVVNCIILGRAEMFAAKNTLWHSVVDGVGMGLGFTLAITIIGLIREILGSGSIFGLAVLPAAAPPMIIFVLAPGGFFVFGLVIAAVNRISRRVGLPMRSHCSGCPSVDRCRAEQKTGLLPAQER